MGQPETEALAVEQLHSRRGRTIAAHNASGPQQEPSAEQRPAEQRRNAAQPNDLELLRTRQRAAGPAVRR